MTHDHAHDVRERRFEEGDRDAWVRASGSSGGLFTFLARASGIDVGQAFPSLVRIDALNIVPVIAWVATASVLAVAGRRSV